VVRLGIEAPDSVPVFREEVLRRQEDIAQPCETPEPALLRGLLHQLNHHLHTGSLGLALLRRQLELGRTRDLPATLDRLEQDLAALRGIVAAAERSAGPRRRRALLVDDDRNELELLAGFLRLAGIEVQTAGDGCDALDSLRRHGPPDVVLLDMVMPRCDGPTTVRAIRGDPALQGLRIFGVTGAPCDSFGLEEGPTGIDRWFHKPLDPEVLLRELQDGPGDVP
jgi:CheY-like chemotaxis protein